MRGWSALVERVDVDGVQGEGGGRVLEREVLDSTLPSVRGVKILLEPAGFRGGRGFAGASPSARCLVGAVRFRCHS